MNSRSLLVVAALLLPTAAPAQKSASSIAGTWEGESVCTVRDSPCHDEHIIYEISQDPPVQSSPAGTQPWKMDGYKIAEGKKQFMGSLRCSYGEAKRSLSCVSSSDADWEFFFEGENMRGTLQLGHEKTLFRKVSAKRSTKN